MAEGSRALHTVTPKAVERFLGTVRFLPEEALTQDRVGVATGLAWTPVGGDILFVEALALPGKGELRLTGHLGDVMKESAQAALSFLRANASGLGIAQQFFEEHGFHVHVPGRGDPQGRPLGRRDDAVRPGLGRERAGRCGATSR